MPKGVQLSSNATTLLPPPAKSPPPKPKADGDQSFEHALKKAQPKAKVNDSDAPEKAHGDAVGVGEKPQGKQKPKSDGAAPVDSPDADQPVDPGAEQTGDTDTSKQPVAQQPNDAPVVEKTLELPDKNQGKPATSHATDVHVNAVAEQLPVAAQTTDAQTHVDESAQEAVAQTNDQPVAPAQAKAVQTPTGQTQEPELPQTAHIDKPAPRQTIKKLPENLVSHESEATDEAAAQADDALPAEPEVAQTSEPAAKSVAPPAVRQQKDAPEQEAPAPEIASAPKVNLKPKQTATTDDEPLPQFQTFENVTDGNQPHHDSTAPTADIQSVIDAPTPKAPAPAVAQTQVTAPQPPVRPEQDFAATNHDRIVSGVKTELLPNGGTMRLRLDPPDLGPLQVSVRMVDGAMTASFETSSDQATRLLSHSLSQLKTALETTGVSVERLHVEQAPRDQQSGSSDPENQRRESQQQQDGARRDQQRREMLNRMWRRLTVGRDPLDMVA